MSLKITDREAILEARRREEERLRQLEEQAARWRQSRGPIETSPPGVFVEKAEIARCMLTTGDAAGDAARQITDEIGGDPDEMTRAQKTPDLDTVMRLLQ